MTSFLQRYLEGNYEEVWADLAALGSAVREETLYPDALAVARETMRRARVNIDILIHRWNALGYSFGYQWVDPIIAHEEQDIALWQSPEGMKGILQSTEKRFRRKGESEDIIKAFLNREKEEIMTLTLDTRTWVKEQPPLFRPPSKNIRSILSEWESTVGLLPLSLYAWYEQVGSINFFGSLPASWSLHFENDEARFQWYKERERHTLDPLYVDTIESPLNQLRIESAQEEHKKGRESISSSIWIAPDEYFKDCSAGGTQYTVNIPNASIDAPLLNEWHQTTFVKYLRICFQWGGLPGLETWDISEDQKHVLREGLLPL